MYIEIIKTNYEHKKPFFQAIQKLRYCLITENFSNQQLVCPLRIMRNQVKGERKKFSKT